MSKTTHINTYNKNTQLKKKRVQGEKEDNPNWKGNKISIGGMHARLKRYYGESKKCSNCGTLDAKRYDWANISGEYKNEYSDYERLCRSCHVKKDKNWIKKENNIYKKYDYTLSAKCKKCNIIFKCKSYDRQYCSKNCWYTRNKVIFK